jgi:hypothetical protein
MDEEDPLTLILRLTGEVGGCRWLNERVLPSWNGRRASLMGFWGIEGSVTVELLLVRLLFLRN